MEVRAVARQPKTKGVEVCAPYGIHCELPDFASCFALPGVPRSMPKDQRPSSSGSQEYSPTGYFIIHQYDSISGKPNDWQQWVQGQTSPKPATAVHETTHYVERHFRTRNDEHGRFLPREIQGLALKELHAVQFAVDFEGYPG